MMIRLLATGFVALALVGCGRPPAAAPSAASGANDEASSAARLVEEGRAFAEAGDALRAQQYFAASLKAGADERLVMPLLLRACIAQKNYRLAAEYAEASLAKHPNDARLRLLSGALHGTLGESARARDRLERAAKELREDADAQFAVAVSFRDDASDVVAADEYFRRYLALAPNGEHAEEARSSLMVEVQ